MKNFSKKCGFLAAAAALLAITAMLVTTGCGNDMGGLGYNDEFTPPPGKGAVRLSFNEKLARTILPDEADFDSLTSFDFLFTARGGSSILKDELGIDPSNVKNPIVLDPGDYDLTVIGYVGSDAVAKNTPAEQITINAAKVTKATIVLKPNDQSTETGNGTFKYKITSDIIKADVTSAVIKLTKIFQGGTQPDVNVLSVWNDASPSSLAVKAGDYYLDLVVETTSIFTFRHVIHIYESMISSYTFSINSGYFDAVFELEELTYEHPDDRSPVLFSGSGASKTTYAKGEEVTVSQGDSLVIEITDASDLFSSYQWYLQSDSPLSTASSFTVNASTGNTFYAIKRYYLVVEGVSNIDGKTYYTFIDIIVSKP